MRAVTRRLIHLLALRAGRACCCNAMLSAGVLACSGADHTSLSETAVEPVLPAPGGMNSAAAPASSAPEQGAIVFRSDRDQAGIGDLYVMAPDGSNVRRLTQGGDYSVPVWSSDGESVVFRQITGVDAALGLVAPASDGSVLLVTAEDPELWDYIPAWSGQELIYASHAGGPDTDLWIVSRSGGQRRPLFAARDGRRYEADVFRPDSRIAFTWKPGEEQSSEHGSMPGQDLWVAAGPDDPAPENLTEGRVYAPEGPRWSPDGSRIAFWGFALQADGSPEGLDSHLEGVTSFDSELFLVDVNTHELSRLTDNAEDDQTPTWTPDGKSLIFMSARDGNEDIFRMPIDAPDEAVNLTENADAPSSDTMPDCFWGVPAK